jgi:hypothetical protein
MRRPRTIAGVVWLVLSSTLGFDAGGCPAALLSDEPPDDSRSSPRESLRMSEAVVCRSIEGYEDYEPLPGAALTSEEKLLVYYRPHGYETVLVKGSYQVHFTSDFQIRRRGEKAVLRQKLKMDYTARSRQPPQLIFLRNTIDLKGLKPGEYDLTIILHDQIAKDPTATQVVRFRVIPVDDPRKKAERDPPRDRTSPPR